MRSAFFAALLLCVSALGTGTACAQAQAQAPDSYATAEVPATAPANAATPVAPAAAPDAPATVVFTGHVKSAAGPLPGAVVKITGSNEMVVTDADGFFHVAVPVNTIVRATASYAGFADENLALHEGATDAEVRMSTAQVVKVNRQQRLKTYLKTARKQNKQTLRRVRR